jgi:hypothetical protein
VEIHYPEYTLISIAFRFDEEIVLSMGEKRTAYRILVG